MKEPGTADGVDEKPLVGEKKQNRTGEHGERASLLSPKPAKAAVEKRGQHQDLRLRLHHECATERKAGQEVVPDCIATQEPDRKENKKGELDIDVTKRENSQEPGMEPIKQGVERVCLLSFQQRKKKRETADVERQIGELENREKLQPRTRHHGHARFEQLILEREVDAVIRPGQSKFEGALSPFVVLLHVKHPHVGRETEPNEQSRDEPSDQQEAACSTGHFRKRSHRSTPNRMATIRTIICTPRTMLFFKLPVTELWPVRSL